MLKDHMFEFYFDQMNELVFGGSKEPASLL